MSSPANPDVAIVGGGPAGAAAAITLARAGRSALIIDKATFPRDKFCGDGLTTTALRLYEELGLDPAQIPSWMPVDDVYVSSASRRVTKLPLPRGQGLFAAVAKREELDAAFLDVARQAGAQVIQGHEVAGARQDRDGVVLDVDGIGEVRAPYAIAADGMWSPMRKYLGVTNPGYRGEWHAFRAYFENVSERAARDLWVWFEPDLVPGYIWSFPVAGGGANIGFGIQRGAKYETRQMKWLWPDLLERPHIREVIGPDARQVAPHRAWPIPARVHDVRLSDGRTMFVGDAAAATDPMTGEGIAQALVTGMHAADAILAAGPTSPQTARNDYEQRIKDDFFADHRLARWLTNALSHRKGSRISLRLVGSTDWTSRQFARWLFEDYPRAILATPRRWRRDMFTRPGAYRDAPDAS